MYFPSFLLKYRIVCFKLSRKLAIIEVVGYMLRDSEKNNNMATSAPFKGFEENKV